jgi:hypothetical protein
MIVSGRHRFIFRRFIQKAAKFVRPRAKAIRAFCGAAADDLKESFLARSDMLHSDRCFWLVRILPATDKNVSRETCWYDFSHVAHVKLIPVFLNPAALQKQTGPLH